MAQKVVIGDAELWLGDRLEVLPTLTGVDAIVTDPPYGTGGWRRAESGAGSNPAARLVREDWDDGEVSWLPGDVPVLAFWPAARMPQLMAAATERGYSKIRMLYMRKSDPKPQVGGRIAWSVEPIVCLSHDGFQLYGGTDWTEASTPRLGRDNDATGHPYQKPLAVMEWLLRKLPAYDLPIVDPFMGSGTTGVACARLGKPFIGVEIEPRYFDIACRRIEEAQRQGDMFRPQPQAKPEQYAMTLDEQRANAKGCYDLAIAEMRKQVTA